MINAAQRGVDVRLIVPSFTDSSVVLQGTQATFTRLLKSGVKIYELKDALLHAKSVVVDGTVTIIGSSNLDMRSFLHNDEVNAIVISPRHRSTDGRSVSARPAGRAPRRAAGLGEALAWQRTKEFFVHMFSYWI
jgi:cardiolipin synthase